MPATQRECRRTRGHRKSAQLRRPTKAFTVTSPTERTRRLGDAMGSEDPKARGKADLGRGKGFLERRRARGTVTPPSAVGLNRTMRTRASGKRTTTATGPARSGVGGGVRARGGLAVTQVRGKVPINGGSTAAAAAATVTHSPEEGRRREGMGRG